MVVLLDREPSKDTKADSTMDIFDRLVESCLEGGEGECFLRDCGEREVEGEEVRDGVVGVLKLRSSELMKPQLR